MNKKQSRLNHAKTTINATLVQLDYLQELTNRVTMTPKQRDAISQQIHNIKVNTADAVTDLDTANVVPLVGQAV